MLLVLHYAYWIFAMIVQNEKKSKINIGNLKYAMCKKHERVHVNGSNGNREAVISIFQWLR